MSFCVYAGIFVSCELTSPAVRLRLCAASKIGSAVCEIGMAAVPDLELLLPKVCLQAGFPNQLATLVSHQPILSKHIVVSVDDCRQVCKVCKFREL
jgi:hypothetical protein